MVSSIWQAAGIIRLMEAQRQEEGSVIDMEGHTGDIEKATLSIPLASLLREMELAAGLVLSAL